MTKLLWDQTGERRYETGVDHGVLYIPTNGVYNTAVAWNGLSTVTEKPSGADATPVYADNIKYLNLVAAEDFGGTIEAYTYPDEFAQCDGTAIVNSGVFLGQQGRKTFGFAYRTKVGNDTDGQDHGYKLHLVYGALAAPSEKAFGTVNDSPEALAFSWDFSTTPVDVTGYKPTALLVVDSTKESSANMNALMDALYGTAGASAYLPLPDEVIAMFNGALTSATPTAPTFVAATGVITIPAVTGVVYHRADTGAVVPSGAMAAIPSLSTLDIYARPAAGYTFPSTADEDWAFTRTT